MKIIERGGNVYARHWGTWYMVYGKYLARMRKEPKNDQS